MALVLKNRVKEETTTTGTGAFALGGASAQFDTFQTYMSDGDTTYYSIAQSTAGTDEWEIGIGTWNTGNTLSRTTVLAGSNGTSAVDFGAGTKEIFMTYPADKAIFKDGGDRLNLTAAGTANNPSFSIDTTTSGTYVHSQENFAANLTQGQTNVIVVGKEGSTKNSGYIGYNWDSAGSDNNYVSLGHWGNNHIMKIYGNGNIAVTGTVDGRDLAADGTKLDGIESGATADQTASEIRTLVESASDSNVFTDADHTKLNNIEANATADQTASEILTAIKTVDGSGSGLDADTLDGVQASSFLRSDASDSHSGTLTLDVVSIGNEIRIPSNTSLTDVSLTGVGDENTGFNWSGSDAVNYISGGVLKYNMNNVWHSGNDGAGSGLDADKLDGLQPSVGASNNTIVQRHASGYIFANYFNTTPNDVSSGITKVCVETGNDGYIRHGTAAALRTFLNVANGATANTGDITAVTAGTGLSGGGTSGSVTLNLAAPYTYIDTATGNYGTVKVDDDRGVGWAGWAIRDDWLLMSDGANNCGIYNDTDNEWAILCRRNAETELMHNGTMKLETRSDGITVSGNIVGPTDIYVADQILHTGDTNTYLQFHAADQWRVVTGGSERFEVNNSAVTVHGTLNVREAIDLADNDILRLGSGDDWELFCNGSHAYMDLNSGIGNLYIRDGTTTRYTFNDNGTFTATGNITAYSDERLKENVQTIDNALEKVQKLRGVTFDWIETGEHSVGVIAQEVEKVIPEVVLTDTESEDRKFDTKSVDYGKLTSVLIEAIKEQQKQIDELKDRLA